MLAPFSVAKIQTEYREEVVVSYLAAKATLEVCPMPPCTHHEKEAI